MFEQVLKAPLMSFPNPRWIYQKYILYCMKTLLCSKKEVFILVTSDMFLARHQTNSKMLKIFSWIYLVQKRFTRLLSSNDIEEIENRTKLTLGDIHKLTKLSVSICYFLHENRIRLLENVRFFGLPLMVTLSESYIQNLEEKAITKPKLLHFILKTFGR